MKYKCVKDMKLINMILILLICKINGLYLIKEIVHKLNKLLMPNN